ncbi:MAG TPA: hypothetical protein VE645_13925 [Pseudonocardiaceae bacterium]|jgi:hypothetical protein|nr:hypothetical protein [Pseudonocardiaceae bacterium]
MATDGTDRVAFAAGLAARFRTVGGVLTGLRQAVHEHLALARSHGTHYPIAQGSDDPGE